MFYRLSACLVFIATFNIVNVSCGVAIDIGDINADNFQADDMPWQCGIVSAFRVLSSFKPNPVRDTTTRRLGSAIGSNDFRVKTNVCDDVARSTILGSLLRAANQKVSCEYQFSIPIIRNKFQVGRSPSDYANIFQQLYGIATKSKQGMTITDLKNLIDDRRPVIILICNGQERYNLLKNLGSVTIPSLHYVVVVYYDENTITYRETDSNEPVSVTYSELDEMWIRWSEFQPGPASLVNDALNGAGVSRASAFWFDVPTQDKARIPKSKNPDNSFILSCAGQAVYCPVGWRLFGDGSGCQSISSPTSTCALWENYKLARCNTVPAGCGIEQYCNTIPSNAGYSCAGRTVCCPPGAKRLGDGSGCGAIYDQPKCALWENLSWERCPAVPASCGLPPAACNIIPQQNTCAGTKVCCPLGSALVGDGSACRGGDVGYCALWGNEGTKRCPGISATCGIELVCKDIPKGNTCAGTDVCCPVNKNTYGDGSACSGGCALWGNLGLPRCPSVKTGCGVELVYNVIPPRFTCAGKRLACPPTSHLIGDGSACAAVGDQERCALWGNAPYERCPSVPTGCGEPVLDCKVIPFTFACGGRTVCCPEDANVKGADKNLCSATRDTPECSLWGNHAGIQPCPSVKQQVVSSPLSPNQACGVPLACDTIPSSATCDGQRVCCPAGWIASKTNDNSLCKRPSTVPLSTLPSAWSTVNKCALWGSVLLSDTVVLCPSVEKQCGLPSEALNITKYVTSFLMETSSLNATSWTPSSPIEPNPGSQTQPPSSAPSQPVNNTDGTPSIISPVESNSNSQTQPPSSQPSQHVPPTPLPSQSINGSIHINGVCPSIGCELAWLVVVKTIVLIVWTELY